MNRAELIQSVVTKSGLKRIEAERAVGAVLDVIQDALSRGDKVVLTGFGSWEVRDRSARTGRNPQTGEEIEIAATRVPVFKAGKTLREAVHK